MMVNRWTGLAIALALMAGLLVTPSMREARASENPIAAKALTYVGTHGGQCWTFMQKVVAEVTGKQIVGDYRNAYLKAGAIEVSAAEATSGDIIQIAADGNTSPWASYPGLHTAIVLENLGGGTFNAVDSNQDWDEMVALRPNYDPYAAAARYGLQVHIYRLDASGAGSGTAAAPAVAPSLAAGAEASVSAGGDCLNLRASASTASARIGCLPSGTRLSVITGNTEAGGRDWVEVQTPLGKGWVAAEYLAAGAAPETPVTVVEATADAPDAEAAPSVEAASDGGVTPIAAATARVDNSPGCLRLRDEPGLGGAIVTCLNAGTEVSLGDAERVTLDGYAWVQVRVAGKSGWVAGTYLIEP